jgi:GrpB-like predicted nucleotidyltransferase (UPF0157 family)
LDALGELAVRAEHVGSTSVPGLASKPIVDLYVLIRSREDVDAAIERLAALGYEREASTVAGRDAFAVPLGEPRHHLYLAIADDPGLRRLVAFRDHLRGHPEDAAAYARLKRELADRYRNDRVAYGDAKSEFVESILS